MRGRTFFMIGMTVGLSAVPVCCQAEWRASQREYGVVPITVFTQDMRAGEVVTFEQISQRTVPEQYVTSSVVKPDSASYVINQRLVDDVQAGDPLRWSDFGHQRAQMKDVKGRLMTIELEPSRAFSGQLYANDHVDVLATIADPLTRERAAQTLLQNVTVLGVTERPAPALTSVQLLVRADQAESLQLAQEVGKLSLALRNPSDDEVLEPHPRTTLASVLSGGERRNFTYACPMLQIIGDPAK